MFTSLIGTKFDRFLIGFGILGMCFVSAVYAVMAFTGPTLPWHVLGVIGFVLTTWCTVVFSFFGGGWKYVLTGKDY